MSGKRAKALAMLVSGDYSLKQIADKLKISEKTLYNWRQEEEFDSELKRRLNIKIGTVTAKALKVQEDMLESHSDMIKHLAAKDLLDRGGFGATNNVKIDADSKVVIVDDIPSKEKND